MTDDKNVFGEQVEPTYLKVETVDGDWSDDPSGYVTTAVTPDGVFGNAVYDLMCKATGRTEYQRPKSVLMTTEDRWSGYSEYAVTSTWTEVIITVPEWNTARRFDSLPAFFKALGDGTTDRGWGSSATPVRSFR